MRLGSQLKNILLHQSPSTSRPTPPPSGQRTFYTGTHIVYPTASYAQELKAMAYKINPFMVQGSVPKDASTGLREDVTKVTHFLGQSFPMHPVERPSVDLPSCLFGVRGLSTPTRQALEAFHQARPLFEPDHPEPKAQEIASWRDLFNQHQKPTENEMRIIQQTLEGVSSQLADGIYLANSFLNLGFSPKLGCEVVVLQTPRFPQRQVEGFRDATLAIEAGAFPIRMTKTFEGMADFIPAISAKTQQPIGLGVHSSRSNPAVYEDVLKVGRSLDISNLPEQIIVLEVKPEYKDEVYHLDLGVAAHGDGLLVGEDILTDTSMAKLRDEFSDITIIPKAEWRSFAINLIIVDERYRADGPRKAVIPTNTPVTKQALESRGYDVLEVPVSYKNGGGFQRCMTNFLTPALDTDTDIVTQFLDTQQDAKRFLSDAKEISLLDEMHFVRLREKTGG